MIAIKEFKGSIIPFSSKSNKYIDLLKEMLQNANFNINEYSKLQLILKKTDFIVLNWIESQIQSKFILFSLVKFGLLYTYIILLNRRSNIIWIMHNKKPHDSNGFDYILSKKIMDLLINKSKVIIIHSNESKKFLPNNPVILNKIIYIPHPNYCNSYGKILNNKTSDKTLSIVFFGAINKYKNIDILIDVVKDLYNYPIKLQIFGNGNSEIINQIKLKIKNVDNITGEFRFINDEEIPYIFSNTHIVVTPYDLNSSLNSGTNILAFSYAKTILGPYNGTLQDMNEINKYFFAYKYTDREDHKEKLKKKLIYVLDNYNSNFNRLNMLGAKCHEFVENNNDIDKLSTILKQSFMSKIN